jgi:hypothetical protein
MSNVVNDGQSFAFCCFPYLLFLFSICCCCLLLSGGCVHDHEMAHPSVFIFCFCLFTLLATSLRHLDQQLLSVLLLFLTCPSFLQQAMMELHTL